MNMENGLHTIVVFDENDKWFVIAEKVINNTKYSYLIRVTADEEDFIDEYRVVQSYFDGKDEFMSVVSGNRLKEILPILVPEAEEFINDKDKLKELLRNV